MGKHRSSILILVCLLLAFVGSSIGARSQIPSYECFEATIEQKAMGMTTVLHIWRKGDFLHIDRYNAADPKSTSSLYIILGPTGLLWNHPWWTRNPNGIAYADELHLWLAFWHCVDNEGLEGIAKKYALPPEILNYLKKPNGPMSRSFVLRSLQFAEKMYLQPPYYPHILSQKELEALGKPIGIQTIEGVSCLVYQQEKQIGTNTNRTTIWVEPKTHLERGYENVDIPPANTSRPPIRSEWRLLTLQFHSSLPDSYFQLPPNTIFQLPDTLKGVQLPPNATVQKVEGLGISLSVQFFEALSRFMSDQNQASHNPKHP